MSRLYAAPTPSANGDVRDVPDRLPGRSSLGASEQFKMGIDQVESSLSRLGRQAGASKCISPAIASALRETVGGNDSSRARRRDEVKRCIVQAHIDILGALTATNVEFGKAYGLGRALADTCRPRQTLDELRESFAAHRLSNLDAWLADLSSKLPVHVGSSVRLSLNSWCQYFAKAELDGNGQGALARAVRRQGQVWRSLLTGEKRAVDMLEPVNYITAGQYLLTGTRRLVIQALRAALPLIVVVALSVVLALILVLVIATTELVRLSVSLLTLAAAIGAAWRAIKPTLAAAAARVEAPLWSSALDEVIAQAMTLRPAKDLARRMDQGSPQGLMYEA